MEVARFILRWQSIGAWVMAAALLYQLGACPCGCLEHNRWLAAARSVWTLGTPVVLARGPASELAGACTHLDSDRDHDCDGSPGEAFLAPSRVRPLDEKAAANDVGLRWAPAVDHSLARRVVQRLLWGESLSDDASLRRARVQVFRL